MIFDGAIMLYAGHIIQFVNAAFSIARTGDWQIQGRPTDVEEPSK